MSRRRQLEEHRLNLGEIRDIMNSMKTLAYMETRKLTRFIATQQQVVNSIETVASDLLFFYPELVPAPSGAAPVYLLIGSERGFCGDFNHRLLAQLDELYEPTADHRPNVIAVGHKLCTLLEGDSRILTALDGAGVVEEVTALLNRLASELTHYNPRDLSLICLFHQSNEQLLAKPLLPPFLDRMETTGDRTAPFSHPPQLQLPPDEFFLQLTEQYLFAVLHEILYTSLMTENHYRLGHLEGAVKHLDEESSELIRVCNDLRQEEITEEIEVILLSADNLAVAGKPVRGKSRSR